MTEIDPGHKYELQVIDGLGPHLLTFVKREGEKYPGNVGHYSGVNLQETFRAAIARLLYLDNQLPYFGNKQIIHNLRCSLMILEIRAAEMHGRNTIEFRRRVFEHADPDGRNITPIEKLPTCGVCGHIFCGGCRNGA